MPIPRQAAVMMITIVGINCKNASNKARQKIKVPVKSLTPDLNNLITAFKTNTQTATRIPPSACYTIAKSEKFCNSEAINKMITIEGNITPKVAKIPPIMPFL